jgi:FkbM family methyltransferase
MSRLLWSLRIFKNHYGLCSRIMSRGDALRVAWQNRREGEVQFRLRPSGREITVRGNTTDFECLKKVLIDREYESPFPVEPRFIIDAGANTGFATIFYSARYPSAKIVAIEPEATNFAVLEKNCRGLPNVTLIQGALWGSETTLGILNPDAAKCGIMVGPEAASGNHSISTVTISGLMKRMGTDHIDILKLDIEGAECEVFESDPEEWLGAVGQIAIELHDWRTPGASRSFYSALVRRPFSQGKVGENIFIRLG